MIGALTGIGVLGAALLGLLYVAWLQEALDRRRRIARAKRELSQAGTDADEEALWSILGGLSISEIDGAPALREAFGRLADRPDDGSTHRGARKGGAELRLPIDKRPALRAHPPA